MQERFTNISFDRKKRPELDFDIVPLESLLHRSDLDHDPTLLHRVQFYILLLVTSGTGKHTIDFEEYEYTRGSVLTIRKNQIHHFQNGDAKGFLLLFTEEYVLSYLEQTSAKKIPELFNELLFDQHTRLNDPEFTAILTLVDQIRQEFNQDADDHTSGIIRNFLQVLVGKIHRTRSLSSSQSSDHKYTSSFMKFQQLVELYCQKERTVQYYADQLNVTTRTLNNITHRVINTSAKSCIDNITILQIKRLLINTTLSIKEIAYRSGFEETTNFFKYFKRYTHQTPESFRASHTKGI